MNVQIRCFFTTLFLLTAFFVTNAQTVYTMGATTGSVTTCNAIVYDNGGASNNYGAGRNDWLTIYPGNGAVTIRFMEFNVLPTDTLYIYNSSDPNNDPYPLQIGGRAVNWVNNSNPIQIGEQQTAATIQNPNGALTLHFVSAANSTTASGFELQITCEQPCQRIYTQIDFANTVPTPHFDEELNDGYYYMDFCPGDTLRFSCYGEYVDNDYSYHQSDVNTTFNWELEGEEYSGVNFRTVSSVFTPGRGSEVILNLVDQRGCHSMTPVAIRVRGSADPLTSVPSLTDVCQGTEIPFVVSYDANVGNIVVGHVGATQESSLTVDSTVFIPDGPNCATECYSSSVNFTSFPANATVTSASDILAVRLNLEHSFIGDINISLVCPNGNSALLMPDHNDVNNYAFFGIYYEPDGSYCDASDNPQGTGWNYCWSENSNYAQLVGNCYDDANVGNMVETTVDSSNVAARLQYYQPTQSFSSLIGCPLNGLWSIRICDTWGSDNGYIFEWELSLDPSLMPQSWTYDVGIESVAWSGGNITETSDSTAVALNDQAGVYTYTFTLTDEFGCEYSRDLPVTVVQIPEPALPEELSICTGSESATLDVNDNYTGNPNLVDYSWNNGASGEIISVSDTGLYTVDIVTYNADRSVSCFVSDTVYVSLQPMPVADFVVSPASGCAPLSTTLHQNCSFVDGLPHTEFPLSYQWTVTNSTNTVVFTSRDANPSLTLQLQGLYNVQLIVSTSGGCSDTIYREDVLNVYAQPHASFVATLISAGIEGGAEYDFSNTTDVSIFGAGDVVTWNWNYGDGQSSEAFEGPHTYEESGNYTIVLSVETGDGCGDSTYQSIRIPTPFYFYIPSGFTPQGDGINEVFLPQGYGFDENTYEMSIYDRTGRMLFHTTNVNQGWDGSIKGKKVPIGSYVYHIQVYDKDGEGHIYKGVVTVIK